MKIIGNTLFVCMLVAFVSCGGGGGGSGGSSAEGTSDPQEEEEAQADGIVTFDELNRTILTPRCIRCHAAFRTEAGVNAQVVPGNPEASQLFIMVESGQMPRNGTPLNSQELQLVRTYIEGVSFTRPMISEIE